MHFSSSVFGLLAANVAGYSSSADVEFSFLEFVVVVCVDVEVGRHQK